MYTPTTFVENTPNFISHIRTRLQDQALLFRVLMGMNLILGAWYLYWRITESINFNALWLSIPLLLAEIYSYIGGVPFFLELWQPSVKRGKSLDAMTPPFPAEEWETVDILIRCDNLPIETVEATAKAALAIDYPSTKLAVYLLKNSHSSEMQDMVKGLALEDLKSPSMQAEAKRLDQERMQLEQQLEELHYLVPEIHQGEAFLESFRYKTISNLHLFSEVLVWFDGLKPDFVPLRTWMECQTVLSEAFSNAVEHAHRQQPTETEVDLEVAIFTQSIQLRIWDYGPPFDFQKSLEELPKTIDEMSERGRGLSIMRDLADSLSYRRGTDGRNCFLYIRSFAPENESSETLEKSRSYLQAFEKFLLFLNPDSQQICDRAKQANLSDRIVQECKALECRINQKKSELTQLSRCHYLTPPQSNAIFSGETSGEFILTLNGDHLPKPNFLQQVLPYFYSYNDYFGKYEKNTIAFVQTPLTFSNLPPGDPYGHSAQLLYDPLQSGKEGINTAFYTGTNAILRRDALVGVGLGDGNGMGEVFWIPENINTAIGLQNAGWKAVYHHEILAEALAPNDLHSTLTQRLQGVQGMLSGMLQENPLGKSGLTFWQKLQYFQIMYRYVSGFFTLIFLACPILYFFTGIIPVDVYGTEFVIHFLPAYVINRITFMVASIGIPAKEVWRSEQDAIALFPLFIQAVWNAIARRPIKFQVTPKQRQSGGFFRFVLPQVIIFVLTILGILWSIYLYIGGKLDNPLAYLVNGAWAIYNLALLWAIVRAAYWQPEKKSVF